MRKIQGKYMAIGILTIILFTCLTVNYKVQADIDWGQASNFINRGKTSTAGGIEDLTDIGNDFSEIGTTLTYIGAGVVVGAMAYMGILYMVSPPEKQAKLKQQLIGLVIAAIVIFGAYFIWKMVVTLLQGVIG